MTARALPAPPMRRRALLGLSAAALAGLPGCMMGRAEAADDPAAQWAAFRDRYVAPDGRVIDTGNGGISHSEGQGYAMLFAETFEDRRAFESLAHWTRRHLRRADGLHAWRWRPGTSTPVEDPNNATDGDLYIAWALLRAADRWVEPEWRREGTRIAGAVLRRLVVEVGGRTVLLPGAAGFVHPNRVVVNPSYYAFPALDALARAVPDRGWARLKADGIALLRDTRYGRWQLPPDWVELRRGRGTGPATRPAEGWPARFSYDAARVPLHLAWAGMTEEPAMRAAASFWNDPGLPVRPAWTDLSSGEVAPYSAPAGIEAVAEVTTAADAGRRPSKPLPTVLRSPDYYSAALAILSRLALREAAPAAAAQPPRRQAARA
jgi:endo-1,4-beta-D-glucanase Y